MSAVDMKSCAGNGAEGGSWKTPEKDGSAVSLHGLLTSSHSEKAVEVDGEIVQNTPF